MRYRDIRPSVSEMGGGGRRPKDDGWKDSVMNPDNYSPSKARELGLINDKEYAQRQTQAQALQGVHPELLLTPMGAARGVAGAVAKDAVGGAVARTAGNAARSEIVPAAGTVVKNVAGRDVATTGGNVSRVTNPELRTIDAPLQIGGPKALPGTANTTKQVGKNDYIDVTARDITNQRALPAPSLGPDLSSSISKVPATTWKDYIAPTTAAVAGHAALGGALYSANQSGKKDVQPEVKPPAEPQGKTLPNNNAGNGQGDRGKDQIAPVTPPKTDYRGSAAAQKLAADNNIANVNNIKVGQTIDLGGGKTHTVQAGDTLDKIAAKSSSSVPPKDAVIPPAPSAASTTFGQDVADKKAANTAPWTKPAAPALNIPNPIDNLDDITRLAGVPKTSTVAPAAAEPPAPVVLDLKKSDVATTDKPIQYGLDQRDAQAAINAEPPAPVVPEPAAAANNTRSLAGGDGMNGRSDQVPNQGLGNAPSKMSTSDFTNDTTARIMKSLNTQDSGNDVAASSIKGKSGDADTDTGLSQLPRTVVEPGSNKVEPLDLTKESRKIPKFSFLSGL